jgi:hypothetical protein
LAAALLARDSTFLRRARRFGRASRWADVECLAQAFHETLLCDRAVPCLAAFLVDDDSELRPEAIDHALALHRTERRRGLEIEPQLDPRVRAIGVLPARSARRRERHLQLVPWDAHRASDSDDVRHGARLP